MLNFKSWVWLRGIVSKSVTLFRQRGRYTYCILPIDSRGWEDINPEDLILYVVVHLSGEQSEKKIISNLLGPIIINPKNNEMVQAVIPNTDYSYDHAVLAA